MLESTSSPQINLTQDIVTFSQIFHNFAVGIGALLAGAGGFKILYDLAVNLADKRSRSRQEKDLKSMYLPNMLGKRFNLIASSKNPDWIYLHDLKTNKKHHIASNWTFVDLGYDRSMIQLMSEEVFNTIDEGERFLTKGEFGT